MEQIQKSLSKIPKKDRIRILQAVDFLLAGDIDRLDVRKLKGCDFYRVRVGKYRIIFYFDVHGEIHAFDIVRRSDNTYKDI